jgi:hypothetical protein
MANKMMMMMINNKQVENLIVTNYYSEATPLITGSSRVFLNYHAFSDYSGLIITVYSFFQCLPFFQESQPKIIATLLTFSAVG